jgi:alpha-tubulin suppressor-like RCC1 family protein
MDMLSKGWHGFALPTVMVSSVVMLILLLSGLTATSSINNAIRGQYNEKMAKEAADSGIRMAVACIHNRTVHTSGLLKPNSTSCTNTTTTATKPTYVLDTPTAKTYFEVSPPTQENYSDARYYNIDVTGYLLLYRPGSSTVWRTITEKVDFKIQYQSQFASISQSGSLYVCGIINNKTFCWGRNVEGQLGNGCPGSPAPNYLQPGSCPASTAYAQDSSGNPIVTQVVRNVAGTSYYDSRSDLSNSLSKDLDIAAGSGSTCIISSSNTDSGNLYTYNTSRRVLCWGDSPNGELGRNIVTTNNYPYPKLTWQTWSSQSPPQYPRQVVAGGNFVCVIANRTSSDTTGNTWCWGNNGKGQLGRNNLTTPYDTPGRVRGMSGDTEGILLYSISATPDAEHVCGRRSDYRAVCWGFNRYGQVGDGTDGEDGIDNSTNKKMRYKLYPEQVITTDDVPLRIETDLKAIAVGGRQVDETAHSCAIGHADSGSPGVKQGRIYCWGRNNYGQMGQNAGASTGIYRRAHEVIFGGNGSNYSASKIAASNNTVCAVVKVPASASTSSVYCWGGNEYGELGINNTTMTLNSTPQRVTTFDTIGEVTDINGGAYRFCAVADFSNYCWGRDHVGQVGDGQVTAAEYRPSLSKFLEPDFQGLSY